MYQLELNNDLIIDNFAGGGGASHAIERALNRPVNIAINHDPAAIGMHTANHKSTKHYINDVFDIVPRDVAAGRRISLAHFSPDCKHFSKAKGGALVERKIRDLAWVVMKWTSLPAHIRPLVVTLENVEEFVTWGPLIDGKPDPTRKGQTFRAFVRALERHGYKVEWRELKACDYGAPTIRKRLFLIARCDGEPIIWPTPTHADPKKIPPGSNLKPWRTAAECIDWSISAPSIFDRKRPLRDNTLRRIARGIQRYVLQAEQPYIVNLTHGGRLEPIDEPLRTLTCANRGEKAVVAPFLAQHNGGFYDGNGRAADHPMATITARGTQTQLVTPFIAGVGGRAGQSPERPVDAPAATITTKAVSALVVPTLVTVGYGEREGQDPRVPGLEKPLGTVVASGQKHALVAAHITKLRGTNVGSGMNEPLHTVSAGGTHHAETTAYLLKYYGNGDGKEPHTLDKPLGAVTTRDRFGLTQVDSGSPPFTPAMMDRARKIADLMRQFGLWDDREFVTFESRGETKVIYDIGMRMLVPRELARAQGFYDEYVLEYGLFEQSDGTFVMRELNKSEQVRMIGNSVSPPPYQAIVEANAPANLLEQARRYA